MWRYSPKQCILAFRKEGCNTERFTRASEEISVPKRKVWGLSIALRAGSSGTDT